MFPRTYGTKPLPCINNLLSHYSLVIIGMLMASFRQSQHWSFLHHRLTLHSACAVQMLNIKLMMA